MSVFDIIQQLQQAARPVVNAGRQAPQSQLPLYSQGNSMPLGQASWSRSAMSSINPSGVPSNAPSLSGMPGQFNPSMYAPYDLGGLNGYEPAQNAPQYDPLLSSGQAGIFPSGNRLATPQTPATPQATLNSLSPRIRAMLRKF